MSRQSRRDHPIAPPMIDYRHDTGSYTDGSYTGSESETEYSEESGYRSLFRLLHVNIVYIYNIVFIIIIILILVLLFDYYNYYIIIYL